MAPGGDWGSHHGGSESHHGYPGGDRHRDGYPEGEGHADGEGYPEGPHPSGDPESGEAEGGFGEWLGQEHNSHSRDGAWGWGRHHREGEAEGEHLGRVIGLSVGVVVLAVVICVAIFVIVFMMKKKKARMVHSEKLKSVSNEHAVVGEKKAPLPAGDVYTGPPSFGTPPPAYEGLVVDKIPEKTAWGYLDPVPTETKPAPAPLTESGDSNPAA